MNAQTGKSKMTEIVIAALHHVTSGVGRMKFQAAWFLLNIVYNIVSLNTFQGPLVYVYTYTYAYPCVYWEIK